MWPDWAILENLYHKYAYKSSLKRLLTFDNFVFKLLCILFWQLLETFWQLFYFNIRPHCHQLCFQSFQLQKSCNSKSHNFINYKRRAVASVTRLGDLLDFGQLFKAFGKQLLCPNLPHSKAILVKVSKSLIFQVKSFLGNFNRHLAIFFWLHLPGHKCSWQSSAMPNTG